MVETRQVTLGEVRAGRDWTPAEARLLDECGTAGVPFGWQRPERPTPKNTLRGPLIRWLLLGGDDDDRPHPAGVWVEGAHIDEALDFESCTTSLDLFLNHCTFGERPVLCDARLRALYLTGSQMPGLDLDRLRTEGDVHLSDGFHAQGPVDLGGASIGGQLACDGGQFDGGEGVALNGDALTVAAGVFLSDGFAATGEVNLVRASIGGQLSCEGGRFDGGEGVALNGDALTVTADVFLRDGFAATGAVDLGGASIGGQLDCEGGRFDGVFRADSLKVTDGFFWRKVTGDCPWIDLTEAHVGVLADDPESWGRAKRMGLSGFTYDHIQSDMTLAERLDWLARKEERELAPAIPATEAAWLWDHDPAPRGFDPRPYTQLAKVFEAQGHRVAAARVLARREGLIRSAERREVRATLDGSAAAAWRGLADLPRAVFDWVFGATFGYGHLPMRAWLWIIGICACAAVFYQAAYDAGQMAPNTPVVLASADWHAAVQDPTACAGEVRAGCTAPLTLWLARRGAQDYQTFNAPLYAADLFVPVVSLGEQSAWAPSPARGALGAIGFWLAVVVQVSGWVITALGAAVLTGLIGRKS